MTESVCSLLTDLYNNFTIIILICNCLASQKVVSQTCRQAQFYQSINKFYSQNTIFSNTANFDNLILKLMQTNLHQKVLSLLNQIQSTQVQKAEAQLRQLSTHESFYSTMFFIMANDTQEWTKTTAATFLNAMFLENTNQQTVGQIFEAIVPILFQPSIKQLDKRVFQKSIIRNIESSTSQLRQKWLQTSLQCLSNFCNFDTAFLLIACLAVADLEESPIPFIIENLYDKILTSLAVNIQNAALLNQMIKMWIVILDKIRNDDSIKYLSADMARNGNLYIFLSKIYEFQSRDNTILTFTEQLEELNFLKYEAAQLHKKILQVELDQTQVAFPMVLDFTKTFLQKISNSLQMMASKIGEIEHLGVQDLLTSLFSIIKLYLLFHTQQFKFQEVVLFLNTAIYPFMAIGDQQRHTFQQQPVQFNTVAEDCCDKQKYGILKTEAASLLQKFGDRIQGVIKYTINRAIQSLQIRMGHVQLNNYSLQVLEIETAFLLISVFSYDLGNHPEQISKIKKILSDQRIYSLPPIQTSRVFTFLAYNYTQLYKNLIQGQHWLQYALSYNAHPTTCYCAFDFVSNIIEDYFNQKLLDKVTDHLAIGKIGLTWDVVYKILQNHFCQISAEGVMKIITKVFIRLKKEIQLLQRHQKQDYMDITNCMRTLTTLLKEMKKQSQNHSQLVAIQTKKQEVIKGVWPILQFYQMSKKYDLEDEVVKISIEIINTLNVMVAQFKPYLQKFIESYKASKYSDKFYLRFMNQYLMKAQFNNNMEEIIAIIICIKQAFLNLSNKILSNEGKNKTLPHYRLTICDIMIVLQNVIAIYGSAMVSNNNLQFFHEISSLCLRFIPTSTEQLQKTATARILQSRVFNLLFLCHMHAKIDIIYGTMELLKDAKLYHNYDTKVLTMCISKQIFQEKDVTAVSILLSGLIDIIILSDQKEENIEKKKKKKKFTADKIKDSSKVYDDFNRLINAIDTPFQNDKTVKDILIDMFRQMKHSNFEMFNSILQALPHQSYQKYLRYVDFEQLEKKRVIRKVIGIKMGEGTNIDVQIHPRGGEGMNDSDDEEMNPLKRQRVKVKIEDKKGKGKVVKFDRKKQAKTD